MTGEPILEGTGEVFRRDQNRESLCRCDYGLTEGPLTTSRARGNQYAILCWSRGLADATPADDTR